MAVVSCITLSIWSQLCQSMPFDWIVNPFKFHVIIDMVRLVSSLLLFTVPPLLPYFALSGFLGYHFLKLVSQLYILILNNLPQIIPDLIAMK